MVRIRMQRTGRRNRPFYRISVVDQRSRRDGRFIEQIGWYDPIASDPTKQLVYDEERAKYWLAVGAQPSDTVRDFFARKSLGNMKAWEEDRRVDRERIEQRKAAAAAAPEAKKA